MIVIGSSMGGVEALRKIVSGMPLDLPAAILIVNHMWPYHRSQLPAILSSAGGLPACHPMQGEQIRNGRIYVAPPDHHMMVMDGHLLITQGPRENWSRPAIDPLFRSAAFVGRTKVVGVILTGLLSDGSSGLWAIKNFGGVTIVQDPKTAMCPSMPQSALDKVGVDHCVPLSEIGPRLVQLANDPIAICSTPVTSKIEIENRIAAGQPWDQSDLEKLGVPSNVKCLDCGAATYEIREDRIVRYRCLFGHGFGAELLSRILPDMSELILSQPSCYSPRNRTASHTNPGITKHLRT